MGKKTPVGVSGKIHLTYISLSDILCLSMLASELHKLA